MAVDLAGNVSEVDLIIDLAAKNFDPLDDLADLVASLFQSDPLLDATRSLVLIGTSFPASMREIKSPSQTIPRLEWLLYKKVVARLPASFDTPTFGDYAISSANMPKGDMRILKPSASVRYTINDAWLITKGSNVQDNGFVQFRDRCGDVATSGLAFPTGHSAGSDYVRGCHAKKVDEIYRHQGRISGALQVLNEITGRICGDSFPDETKVRFLLSVLTEAADGILYVNDRLTNAIDPLKRTVLAQQVR